MLSCRSVDREGGGGGALCRCGDGNVGEIVGVQAPGPGRLGGFEAAAPLCWGE